MMIVSNKYTFSNGQTIYKPTKINQVEKAQQEKEKGRIIKRQIRANNSTREWTV